MEEKHYHIPEGEKEIIKDRPKKGLQGMPEVLFAYLHGSFRSGGMFRDIDMAVYLESLPASPLDLELRLEAELSEAIGRYPVDVRILNGAPLSFRYNVIKDGEPIVVNDDDARADFEEGVLSNYFDFAPFRRMYLKEALGIEV